MHIPVDELGMAVPAIARCLPIGGRHVNGLPNMRSDVVGGYRDANGRLLIPELDDRIQGWFLAKGFNHMSSWTNADSMGRDAVEWKSVLMEPGT
jgi:hypothetical protein